MSKFKSWIPAILYMALIFFMSSHPAPEQAKWLPIYAQLKLVHIIEYGILYVLLYWPLRKTTSLERTEAFWVGFMLTLIYGLSDEFHQIWVVGRTPSLVDAVADGAGAVLANFFVK